MSLGFGVMIGMLTSNEKTVNAVQASLGLVIADVRLEDNKLRFAFTDGSKLSLWDNGQSCCEQRYMVCADDLAAFRGATLLDFELVSAPGVMDDCEVHEVQFLDVKTSLGAFQCANHNEHNGYYGGFHVVAARSAAQEGECSQS